MLTMKYYYMTVWGYPCKWHIQCFVAFFIKNEEWELNTNRSDQYEYCAMIMCYI